MRQAKYWIILLPLILVLACVGAYAQANSEITGIVTDQTGAVVGGASITLIDPATGIAHTTASSGAGLYDFSGLNPANYNLKVAAKGFQNYVQTGIVVNVSGTFTVNVKLTVGAATETVSVVADALTVQTDSNVVSTLITSEDITSIATENRNIVNLAALGMGVSSELPDNNSLGAFGANFSIEFNGLREAHNIWLIDGGESADRGGGGGTQIQPSQDAIAEFQMMTSNYPPDYGISSGATISMSLKSGTSKFHGAAWEENRATAYNANAFFNKYNGAHNARPATHYNIYGFNVGGPIYIPNTYNTNKNKGFFFFNQEWRKTSAVATSNNATLDKADVPVSGTDLTYVDPTYAAAHGAGFTWLQVPAVPAGSDYQLNHLGALTPGGCFQGVKALDSVSGKMLCPTGQKIPHGLFDSNAVIYMTPGTGPLPSPNVGTTDFNVASVPLPQKVEDTVVRGDYNFNDKWALLVHYIGDHQNQNYGQPELGWCGCNYNTLTSILSSPAHSATAKLTGAIKPNLLLEVSMNYDGNGADITPSANTFLPSTWTVAPVVTAYTITRKIWPGMGWGNTLNGGRSEDTATEPYHNAAQDYEPKVDVSYTTGKHQFKFGFSWNHYTKNQMLYGDAQGNYSFNQLSGDTLMDTLLGLPGSYSQTQSAPIRHYAENTTSGYAQDNWHATSRLSLQLGIRYDALPHSWERQNLLGNFNQNTYQTGAAYAPIWNADGTISSSSADLYTYNGIPAYINGTNLAGYEGYPRGVVTNDYKTWQPRIGFSDDLFGNGKTILRGGFGTFYERLQGNDIFGVATSAPFDPSLNLSNPYFSTPGKNWSTGNVIAPTSLIFAGGGDSIAQTFRAPAVAMFSLGVQREVTHSVIWVVQYVGNLQWHQNIVNNALNSLPTSGGLVNIATGTSAGTCTTKSTAPPFTCMDARQVAGDGSGNYSGDSYVASVGPPVVLKPDAVSFGNNGGQNAYRSYPGYAGISQDEDVATGDYNGLQTAVRIQNRWGLSGEVDYTYSHQIDIQSQDRNNVDNPWYIKYDKGSGSYDRRHILNANYVYNLPFFNKSEGLVKSIAGGWQIAGTFVKETGVPDQVNLNLNYDPVGLGGGYTNHPNITPGGKLTYPKTVTQWFDTTRINNAITPVWAGGTNLGFGNWGKDVLVNPGRFNLTTSLYKTFQIYKTANFQLKFESFNTLNHTEFNGINNVSGALNGTNDPRNLQLAGKFNF
ncbi:MAG: carboxypeptidase regulatory-like domain-containing protein [Terracidiphilus sp.]